MHRLGCFGKWPRSEFRAGKVQEIWWCWSLGVWGFFNRVASLVFGLWGEETKLWISVQTVGFGKEKSLVSRLQDLIRSDTLFGAWLRLGVPVRSRAPEP